MAIVSIQNLKVDFGGKVLFENDGLGPRLDEAVR